MPQVFTFPLPLDFRKSVHDLVRNRVFPEKGNIGHSQTRIGLMWGAERLLGRRPVMRALNVQESTGTGQRRVTIMLSWISREFLRAGGQHRGYPMGNLLKDYAYP